VFQATLEDLVTKCGMPMAPSESVTHKLKKTAGQLLAAADKIIDVGRDLNAVTSCMLDVSADAEADDRDLNHGPHMLAWANWTSDLTSDVLDACDDLIRAIHDLIGESGSEQKRLSAREAQARAKRKPERAQPQTKGAASNEARSLKGGT
jgi:hypothetical protein